MKYRITFINPEGTHKWDVPEGKTLSWGITRVFEENKDRHLVIFAIEMIQGKKTTYL